MKNWILLLTAVCLSCVVVAQKHFIYLQTENNVPFYARMGDKILSSTFSGYIILADLKDSTYNLSIGYAGKNGESKFIIEVRNKDRGFLVKDVDGVINLFDLLQLTLLRPANDKASSKYSYQKRDDAFTKLLAKAANDSSLLYVRVEIEEPKPEKEKHTIVVTDPEPQKSNAEKTAVVPDITNPIDSLANEGILRAEPKTEAVMVEHRKSDIEEKKEADAAVPVVDSTFLQHNAESENQQTRIQTAEPQEYKRSIVTQRSESSTNEGFGLVFWDETDGLRDTIRILIPNPQIVYKISASDSGIKEDKKFLDISDSATVVPEKQDSISETKITCSSQANNKDFLDLRKTMAAQETEKDMIAVAGRAFLEKCYTTEQIKNLSSLFLSDETKFSFFQSAINATWDKEKFYVLQSELKEELYLSRFKALIEQ